MASKRVLLVVVSAALASALVVAFSTPSKPGKIVVADDIGPGVPPDEPNAHILVPDEPTPAATERESERRDNEVPQKPPYPLTDSPAISADAAVLAWVSHEAMVDEDTNDVEDVYARDRRTHKTERASVSWSGRQGNARSFAPAISADGTRIAFVSLASNLVPNDTNGKADVFVRDLSRGTTIRVSVASDGAEGNGDSGFFQHPPKVFYASTFKPSISADGAVVVFDSEANNLTDGDDNDESDVFVRDIGSSDTTLVSATPAGVSGSGLSLDGAVSSDGRRVAFASDARDLIEGTVQTSSAGDFQIFVRDLPSGKTQQASLDGDGKALAGPSLMPVLDRTGHVIAFATHRWERTGDAAFVLRDLDGGSVTLLWRGCEALYISFSGDASVLAWGSAGGCLDPEAHMTGGGTVAGATPEVSPDGRYVIFDAGLDPYTLDEEQYGGDFGAMVYDRETKRYTAAYKW